jgi:hypothetical protein
MLSRTFKARVGDLVASRPPPLAPRMVYFRVARPQAEAFGTLFDADDEYAPEEDEVDRLFGVLR